ncbi:MAG: hypothetical protein M0Q38_04285 [Bacteroidales bacterium]|jgi:hypothetical protein|nr:hypothetical protein [Bacteroidales bacterium]
MKFFLYIFYRFKTIYKYKNSSDGWIHAYIVIGALLLIHILTIIGFVQGIVKKDVVSEIRIDNGLLDRFLLFPLLISPIYILLYIYYRKNKVFIKNVIDDFKNETVAVRKRRGWYVSFYLVVSILLLLFSVVSPIFFN